MNGNEYQEKAHSFASKGGDTLMYSLLGAIEEVGEICEKMTFVTSSEITLGIAKDLEEFVELAKKIGKRAKTIRKGWDEFTEDERKSVLNAKGEKGIDKEIGDAAWMLANVAYHLGLKMDDVLKQNIDKLDDRKNRNVIIGEGDNR